MTHLGNKIFSLIRFVRFPLMVLVVMIHAHFYSVSVGGYECNFTIQAFPVYNNISYFISELLSRIAVPIFYIVSGFLFFRSVKKYNFRVYVQKVRSRIMTLFVPYIFWNLLVIAMYFFAQHFIPSLTSGANRLIVDYNFCDWLTAFWAYDGTWMPICYQLWFIRDLFVVVLLSPIVYFAIKVLDIYIVGLFLLLWLFNFRFGVIGLNITAISFFSLGALLSLKQCNLFYILNKVRVPSYVASVFLVVVEMAMFNLNELSCLHPVLICVLYHTCIFSLLLACLIFVSDRLRANSVHISDFLHDSNFFIYAFHAMPLTLIIKLLAMYIRPASDLSALLIYFMAPMLTIVLGLFLFAMLRRLFPKFTALITGSRV